MCKVLRGEPDDEAGRLTSMTKISSSHRHGRRRTSLLSPAIASALVLVSCGGEGRETVGAGGDPGENSSVEVAIEVECGSSVFDLNDSRMRHRHPHFRPAQLVPSTTLVLQHSTRPRRGRW